MVSKISEIIKTFENGNTSPFFAFYYVKEA